MKLWLKLSLLLPAAAMILTGCEEEHAHRYESEIIEPASCTADGVMQYTCACGDTYTATVPAEDAHAWDDGEITPAACGKTGSASYTCIACGEKKEEELPATGTHTWGEAEVIKAATCAAPGEVSATCTVCGETMHTSLAQLTEHSFGEATVTKAATCGTDGESASVCTVCGEKKTASVAKTGNHSWDGGTVTKAATCSAEGVKTVLCTACNEKKEESLPKSTEHSWKSSSTQTAASCGTAGKESVTCTVCGTASTRTIPATGAHSWDAGKITTASTCYQNGTVTHTCTACGQTKTASAAKSETHSWNGGVTTRAASCARDGVTTYTCTLCRTTKTEAIPKTGRHIWTTKITEPTADAEGEKTISCSVCGKVSHTEKIDKLSFDPSDYRNPYCVRTSYRSDSYIEYRIEGNTLTVVGTVKLDGVKNVFVTAGGWQMYAPGEAAPENYTVDARFSALMDGAHFRVQVPLDKIEEGKSGPIRLLFYGDKMLAVTVRTDVAVEKVDGVYRFVESPALENNLQKMAAAVNPKNFLDGYTPEMKALSDQIVGAEKDDARKLYLLYKWVAENVYSDTSTSAQTDAATAFATRRGTSSGYTSLLIALIRAQGIPAIRVGIFRSAENNTGVMSDTDAAATNPNYNCVEAYLEEEDRWVMMDPTAASKNKMESGNAKTNPMDDAHFDITPWHFAKNSKILERPRSW